MHTTISITHYLVVSGLLFSLGLMGLIMHFKNIIALFMSIELMLLGVNINLVAFSSFLNNMSGQVFSMFVLTVAAAEAAIGLAILVIYYRHRHTVDVADIHGMKG